jgi:hypothetical protein
MESQHGSIDPRKVQGDRSVIELTAEQRERINRVIHEILDDEETASDR